MKRAGSALVAILRTLSVARVPSAGGQRPKAARLFVALVLALAGFAVVWSAPGAADDQGALDARINQTVSKSYPALIGTYPPSPDPNVPDPDPANCASLPSCGLIHLTVEQPENLSIFDDFAIEVELKWDNSAPVDNDMDLYLWYDPQGANSIDRTRTKKEPERIRFGEPTSASYLLVITNASGANRGYTVTVNEIWVRGERPSELDGPTPTTSGASSSSTDGGSTPPPRMTATTSKPSTTPVTPPLQLIVPSGEVPSGLSGGVISPDPDLAGLNPTTIAGATGGGGQLFKEGVGPSGPPKKVPAPILIFWTVIVPLVIALGSATMFLRLRPKALTVRVPATR